jgi:hypothetical protein
MAAGFVTKAQDIEASVNKVNEIFNQNKVTYLYNGDADSPINVKKIAVKDYGKVLIAEAVPLSGYDADMIYFQLMEITGYSIQDNYLLLMEENRVIGKFLGLKKNVAKNLIKELRKTYVSVLKNANKEMPGNFTEVNKWKSL